MQEWEWEKCRHKMGEGVVESELRRESQGCGVRMCSLVSFPSVEVRSYLISAEIR